MKVENSIKLGYTGGRFFQYPSLEGGSDTIGYGHKLKAGENFTQGITDQEAMELLKADILNASYQAEYKFDKRFGAGSFHNLDARRMQMLADIEFNVKKGLTAFPMFTLAVSQGNEKAMLKQSERSYFDIHQGKRKPLSRNKDFKRLFFPVA